MKTVPSTALLPPSGRPAIDAKAVAEFCDRYRVKTLYLFGSVLTDEFTDDSDVDIMFEPEGATPSYFEQMK